MGKEEKERSSFTITQQREKNMSKNMRNGTQNTAKVSHQTTRLRATHTGVSKASSLRATHTGGSNRQESSFAATHQDGSNRQESSLTATHQDGSNRQETSLRATHTGGSNRQCNDGSNRHKNNRTGGWSKTLKLLILAALIQVSWGMQSGKPPLTNDTDAKAQGPPAMPPKGPQNELAFFRAREDYRKTLDKK